MAYRLTDVNLTSKSKANGVLPTSTYSFKRQNPKNCQTPMKLGFDILQNSTLFSPICFRLRINVETRFCRNLNWGLCDPLVVRFRRKFKNLSYGECFIGGPWKNMALRIEWDVKELGWSFEVIIWPSRFISGEETEMMGFLCLVVSFLISVSFVLSRKIATTMTMMVKRQRNGCDFKETEIERRSWSNLPTDILNEIKGRLYFVEQIRLRAICKSWRLAHCVRSADKLPWLMTHDWHWANNGNILSICKFHFPSFNQTHSNEYEMDGEEWEDIYGASVCASKYGWLLLQKTDKTCLYNPFTKEIIKLPDIDTTFNRSTFSLIPTSPDCVFFAIQSSKSSNTIIISTCRHGDLEWKTHTFDGFFRVIEDVVYSSGAFYCVFSGGVLGAFFVALQDWSLLTDMAPITGIKFRDRAQLVESGGDLLMVCPSERLHVFRFNWSQMAWVKKNSLGNQALFLGCTSFSLSAPEEQSDLANRIYYHVHGNTHICFYSLKTQEFHQCCEFYPWVTQGEPERIWIEPPRFLVQL